MGTRAGSGTSLLLDPDRGPLARARRLRWWRGDRTDAPRGAGEGGTGGEGGEGSGKGRGENPALGAKAEPDSKTPRRRQVSPAGGGEGAGAPAGRVGAGPEGRRGGEGAGPSEGPRGQGRRWPRAPTPGGLGREGGRSAWAARRVSGAAELAPRPVSLLQAPAARQDAQAGRADSLVRGPQKGRGRIRTGGCVAYSPQPDPGDAGPRRVGTRAPLRPGVRSSAKK